jgi:AcrR family transcriptional regulator
MTSRGRARHRREHPIWLREEPGRRRRPVVDADSIAAAALAVADAEGLEAVSMRRIAASLGVGTMTLYSYVRSKDDLLDLMSDAVAAETLVPDLPSDWREALTAIAHRARTSYQRHPWTLDHAARRSFGSPNMLRHIEQSTQAVSGIDADWETRTLFLMAVDDYALGYAVRERLMGQIDLAPLEQDAFGPYLERLFATGEFPLLAQAFGEGGFRMPDLEGRFEQGLALLLDGMEAHLRRV